MNYFIASINVSLNEQFNDWSFWKAPLLDLELGHLTPAERQLLNTPSPVAAAVSVATAAGNTIPSKSSSSSLLSSSAAAKAPTIGGSNNATMNSSVSSHSTTANTFSTSSKFTALARAAKGVNSSNNNPHLNSSDAAATGSTAVNEDGTPFSDTTQQSIFTSAFELDQGNEGDDEEGVGDGEEEDEYEDEYYEEEEEEDDFADVNVVKQNPATFL